MLYMGCFTKLQLPLASTRWTVGSNTQ